MAEDGMKESHRFARISTDEKQIQKDWKPHSFFLPSFSNPRSSAQIRGRFF